MKIVLEFDNPSEHDAYVRDQAVRLGLVAAQVHPLGKAFSRAFPGRSLTDAQCGTIASDAGFITRIKLLRQYGRGENGGAMLGLKEAKEFLEAQGYGRPPTPSPYTG